MAHVYHWKHGWIPLDHVAALSKAKGNHVRAATLLEAAHGPGAGIKSRRDVAGAIRSLPSVPESDRSQARADIAAAAQRHDSTDLLPRTSYRRSSAELQAAADAKHAEAARAFNAGRTDDPAVARLGATALRQHHKRTDASLSRMVAAQEQAHRLEGKAALARSREAEAARTKLTHEDLKGAKLVRTKYGWHQVVRVNAKTVTVKTPYSWTDTIAHGKILEARH